MRRIVLGLCVVLLAVTAAFAGKGTPLIATFLPNLSSTGYGVSSDANAIYSNGVNRVQVYFASGGGTVDLITYSTGRKLSFAFDPSSNAFQASGLPQLSQAEVDLYGINFYGPFSSMGINTTAQLKTSLQFKSGSSTYELAYPSLATKRLTADTWLITSDPADVGGDPGFDASDSADLGVFRKRSRTDFGTVNMPIRFQIQLK
jgi:hypothetical protein